MAVSRTASPHSESSSSSASVLSIVWAPSVEQVAVPLGSLMASSCASLAARRGSDRQDPCCRARALGIYLARSRCRARRWEPPSVIIGTLSAIDRNHCPPSIGTGVRNVGIRNLPHDAIRRVSVGLFLFEDGQTVREVAAVVEEGHHGSGSGLGQRYSACRHHRPRA